MNFHDSFIIPMAVNQTRSGHLANFSEFELNGTDTDELFPVKKEFLRKDGKITQQMLLDFFSFFV